MGGKAKITVLKKLVDERERDPLGPRPCGLFREGQQFVVAEEPPEGFCPWAWADIREDLEAVRSTPEPLGAGGAARKSRCADRYSPVVFLIEGVEGCR